MNRYGMFVVTLIPSVMGLWLMGCQDPSAPQDEPAPGGNMDEEVITDARGVQRRTIRVYAPDEIGARDEVIPALKAEPLSVAPQGAAASGSGNIEPQVRAMLASAAPGSMVEVIVSVEPPGPMPQLPRLLPTELRGGPNNQQRLQARQRAFDAEHARRLGTQAPHVSSVQAAGGQVLEQHTLCNCFTARMPASFVATLAAHPDIRHIDPRMTGDRPPDSNPSNDLIDGRARINSDTYYNAGYDGSRAGYYVGVLDTGIRNTHTMFSAPDHIDFERDCTAGGTNCENTGSASWTPDDDCWDHGTSTIGIITGNGNVGADWRGVTNAIVDSWKVYPKGCGYLDVTAAVKAFDRAVYWGDDVIVAEMQASLSETSSLSAAADAAFDAGAIVIAANGNYGPGSGTVKAPANAHKALGIGAYDVETLATPDYQSRGPTADGRFKPDFQMPTNTESATTACNTCVRPFGGTSGATPYGGAAAILLRHWFDSLGLGVEPGKLYAGLLAFGSRPYPYDNNEGAGDMLLGNLYCRRWMSGSRTISQGQTIDIPFGTVDSQWDLQVAIWWPEGTTYHNDVDLYVVDPAGGYRASAISTPSVFEMSKVNGNLSPGGTWNLRLYGYNVPTGPQTVYYMIYHKVVGCGG